MKEFTKQEMLDFAKYYYDLNRCRQSLEKELSEWSTEMEASKISSNGMLAVSLPLSEIQKFAEWMEQKYKKKECVGVDGWNRDTTQYSGTGLLTIWMKESGNDR